MRCINTEPTIPRHPTNPTLILVAPFCPTREVELKKTAAGLFSLRPFEHLGDLALPGSLFATDHPPFKQSCLLVGGGFLGCGLSQRFHSGRRMT
jgi:hypothetical protein